MDYTKLVNLYVGREVSLDDYGFMKDESGFRILFWNIQDKLEPTIEQLEELQSQVEKENTIENLKAQIVELEAKQPRALRELALNISGAKERLQDIDTQIRELRSQINEL